MRHFLLPTLLLIFNSTIKTADDHQALDTIMQSTYAITSAIKALGITQKNIIRELETRRAKEIAELEKLKIEFDRWQNANTLYLRQIKQYKEGLGRKPEEIETERSRLSQKQNELDITETKLKNQTTELETQRTTLRIQEQKLEKVQNARNQQNTKYFRCGLLAGTVVFVVAALSNQQKLQSALRFIPQPSQYKLF